MSASRQHKSLVVANPDPRAGAVARLRWGSHAFSEIDALADSGQARLFNAVDDKSTTAKVLAAIGPKSDPAMVEPFARNFFVSKRRFDFLWFAAGKAAHATPGPG